MHPLPQISEAEFEVMKIVWNHAPVSTNEITERLTGTTSWSPRTIQTLIRRLVNKGALSYEKKGRVFVYTPAIQEKEYIGQKSRSFLRRYFGGDITALVSSCLEPEQLSEQDLEHLRVLLDGSAPKSRKETDHD